MNTTTHRATLALACVAFVLGILMLAMPADARSSRAERGHSFPHPGGGTIWCIQAPCPRLPGPIDRGAFPHPCQVNRPCLPPCEFVPNCHRGTTGVQR